MPNYIASQMYCYICGGELNGLAYWTQQGIFEPYLDYELWCSGCGRSLYGREAKYEFEAALVELQAGGLYA